MRNFILVFSVLFSFSCFAEGESLQKCAGGESGSKCGGSQMGTGICIYPGKDVHWFRDPCDGAPSKKECSDRMKKSNEEAEKQCNAKKNQLSCEGETGGKSFCKWSPAGSGNSKPRPKPTEEGSKKCPIPQKLWKEKCMKDTGKRCIKAPCLGVYVQVDSPYCKKLSSLCSSEDSIEFPGKEEPKCGGDLICNWVYNKIGVRTLECSDGKEYRSSGTTIFDKVREDGKYFDQTPTKETYGGESSGRQK